MISWMLDRRGRFSPLRAITLLLLILPAAQMLLLWSLGALAAPLGADGMSTGRPVMAVIHGTGDWALYFLLISLAVTPLRFVLDWQRVTVLRRRIGVAAACYAAAHLALYCVDQKYNPITIATEIALRFYLTVGFVVVLGLIALWITSTDSWVQRLGRRWKSLHRLTYPLTALALYHYFLQTRIDVSASVFVAGLFVWELLWRLQPSTWRRAWWPLPALALLTGGLTALIETAWYGLATSIDPLRVLAANLDIDFGPRPAVAVALVLLAGSLLAAGVQAWKEWRPASVKDIAS
jgi:sulfoxide reductase heme-binding subunit YedZ